ncbi:MAG: hypothetical protein KF860_14725 [Cyclobacteriaceae bacterium]|nr:hypothetical protein [Cyclobacteriaceae bacterium]
MIGSKERHNEPIWDKAHSTYMRIIYLENGYTLTGYSKKVGRNERRDKVDLLTNWILRDLKAGYLDKNTTNPKITRVDRIEYFLRKGDSYEPIINLYYEFPEWSNVKWMEYKKFYSFINRFYWMIRNQSTVTTIANALEVRTRAPKQDPLDISRPRFASLIDLNAYVHRLKSDSDLPSEAIENFYRKYTSKYFDKI